MRQGTDGETLRESFMESVNLLGKVEIILNLNSHVIYGYSNAKCEIAPMILLPWLLTHLPLTHNIARNIKLVISNSYQG